ncbi:MAG: PRC-barrel domain-containing protein [Pirellulales bacterium]
MSRTARRHALPALTLLAAVAFGVSTLSLWTVLLGTKPARAGETPPDATAGQGDDKDKVEIQLGPITHAGQLAKKKVADADGNVVGKVDDLLLDLGAGHVALVLVSPSDGQGQVLVPASRFKFTGDASQLSLKPEGQPLDKTERWKNEGVNTGFNRAQIAKLYERDKQPLYHVEPDAADVTGWFSGIAEQQVHNTQEVEIGSVVDLAITLPDGAIAYAAVSCDCFADSEQKLFPIPLSAFVVKPGAKAWILELPLDIVERTPTFAKDAWPTEIDRGWVEYVHVRYGRSPLGGVREQLRSESPAGQVSTTP